MSESMPASPLWQVKRSSGDTVWTVFGISLIVVWLLLWECSVRLALGRQFFAPPSEIIVSFYRSLLVTGELRTHLWATVTRLFAGLMIGAVPALWLGFLMGRNKRACFRYGPFVTVLGLIPMLSALPWFIPMFGPGISANGPWSAALSSTPFCTARPRVFGSLGPCSMRTVLPLTP